MGSAAGIAYPAVVDRRGRGGWAAGNVLVALVLTTLLTGCGGDGSAAALSTIPTRPASLTTATGAPSGPSLSSSSQVHVTVTVLTHLPTRSFAILRSGAASRDQPIGLYATNGFVDFTPITPPIDMLANGPEFASGRDVLSASFPTIDDGWVTETTGGGGAGVLLHTIDGGASWEVNQELPGGPSPISYVSFVSSEDGWLVKGEQGCGGTCGPNLYRTTNGGVTWQHLLTVHELFELSTTSDPLPTFANSMDGIATTRPKVIASSVTASKASLRKHEEPTPSIRRGVTRLTTDGGSTWRQITVPIAGKGVQIYQRPVFFATGRRGVIPSLVIHQTGKELDPVTVDFSTTSDSGTRWRAGPTFASPARVVINPSTSALSVTDVPSASVASAKDWWVMAVKPSGDLAVSVTTDAGRTWKRSAGQGLPVVVAPSTGTVPALVQALSATTAYASIRSRTEPPATYVTTDGGARWSLVAGLTDTADSACFHLPTMPPRSQCSAGSPAEH